MWLEQWLPIGGNFALKETLGNVWTMLRLSQLRECYWHLVEKVQGCCERSYKAHDSPPQHNYWTQNVNSIEVKIAELEQLGVTSGSECRCSSKTNLTFIEKCKINGRKTTAKSIQSIYSSKINWVEETAGTWE